jgi:hypothetical protein
MSNYINGIENGGFSKNIKKELFVTKLEQLFSRKTMKFKKFKDGC